MVFACCDKNVHEKDWRRFKHGTAGDVRSCVMYKQGTSILPEWLVWQCQAPHAKRIIHEERARRSGKIALSGSRRLRSTLAAASVLFAHAVVTEVKNIPLHRQRTAYRSRVVVPAVDGLVVLFRLCECMSFIKH